MYTGPNKLAAGQKFLVCIWGPGANQITRRKGFKTLSGARRFGERKVAEDGIYEASILVKDKGNREWPWRRIERITPSRPPRLKGGR